MFRQCARSALKAQTLWQSHRGAVLPAATRHVAPRAHSSNPDPPKFDAEMVELYNHFANQHRHPAGPWGLMLEQVRAASPSASGAGLRVLDLASGPGEPAITIAQALPDAQVVSTDVSEDMVKSATAAAAGVPNVTVQLADAEDLSAFPDGSVDVVTCCYGYMFPQDKELALRETLRVLKPGGTLVATTWDRVDIIALARDVMTEVLGAPPPPPPLNPMALAEPGLFESLVEAAGFGGIATSTSTYPFDFTADEQRHFKLATMLIKDKIQELDKWEVAEKAVWANIDKYTTVDASGNRIMPENTFKLTVAKKP